MTVNKYQYVAGYNHASTLATLTIQPTAPCPGIVYGVTTYAGPGYLYFDNPTGALAYKVGMTPARFNTVVSQLGLNPDGGVAYVMGTLRYKRNDNTFQNYNVILYYPENGKEMQRGFGRWSGTSFKFVITGDAS